MIGMHEVHGAGSAFANSADYTVTGHFELAPTSAAAQISLSGYYEQDDISFVAPGITRVEYIDSNGVSQHDDYGSSAGGSLVCPNAVAVNKMTRIDWQFTVGSCRARYLLNLFYWHSVY